jgi:spore coat protein U-like protein
MLKKIIAGALASATLLASPAFAATPPAKGTADGRLDVQLEVITGCAFATGVAGTSTTAGNVGDAVLSFGKVNPGTIGDATGKAVATGTGSALMVTCSSLPAAGNVTLTLDKGQNPVSSTQRAMINGLPGGKTVAYNLYHDAGYSVEYVPGTAMPLTNLVANVATPVDIYGRVPDVSGLSDGLYTDVVKMTLTF